MESRKQDLSEFKNFPNHLLGNVLSSYLTQIIYIDMYNAASADSEFHTSKPDIYRSTLTKFVQNVGVLLVESLTQKMVDYIFSSSRRNGLNIVVNDSDIISAYAKYCLPSGAKMNKSEQARLYNLFMTSIIKELFEYVIINENFINNFSTYRDEENKNRHKKELTSFALAIINKVRENYYELIRTGKKKNQEKDMVVSVVSENNGLVEKLSRSEKLIEKAKNKIISLNSQLEEKNKIIADLETRSSKSGPSDDTGKIKDQSEIIDGLEAKLEDQSELINTLKERLEKYETTDNVEIEEKNINLEPEETESEDDD